MFQGAMVAVVTPFKDGQLDENGLRQLIEFQIANGTRGIIPCGTTGESPTLSHEEHERVVAITVEQVNKRIPVIAGTGPNNTAEAIRFTKHARWWGPGPWRGGWWGPGWWGSAGWWGPGAWPGGCWAGGAWPGPWWGPGVWVPPASPTVVVAPTAPVFVERSPPAEAPAQVWWYWCNESRAYYPYVKECPAGWQRVAPQTVVPADRTR